MAQVEMTNCSNAAESLIKVYTLAKTRSLGDGFVPIAQYEDASAREFMGRRNFTQNCMRLLTDPDVASLLVPDVEGRARSMSICDYYTPHKDSEDLITLSKGVVLRFDEKTPLLPQLFFVLRTTPYYKHQDEEESKEVLRKMLSSSHPNFPDGWMIVTESKDFPDYPSSKPWISLISTKLLDPDDLMETPLFQEFVRGVGSLASRTYTETCARTIKCGDYEELLARISALQEATAIMESVLK